jgi:hypothetical protein
MNEELVDWLCELESNVISVLIAATLLFYILVSLSWYPKSASRIVALISPPGSTAPAASPPTPVAPTMAPPSQCAPPTVPVSELAPTAVTTPPVPVAPTIQVPSDDARKAAGEVHAASLTESLARQTAARNHHANLITASIERKKEQIDQFFEDQLALAQVQIQGARLIQEANLEHELYKAIVEGASRPGPPVRQVPRMEGWRGGEMAVGRTVLQSPLPVHRQLPAPVAQGRERMYEVREPVYEMREPVYEMRDPVFAVREPVYEVPDEVEEGYAETAHLGDEVEEEEVPVMWKNPESLGERIGTWQQGVEAESDKCSQVSTAFRRRV